ncbi:DEAD/DEAH box helicase [Palleronia sp. KMU-117]|uniref:DEAD/DEAH box helicase n=1 Tax=Palleronia sp. KMU-117 TaxID=3434108 RepID=UPI003D705522
MDFDMLGLQPRLVAKLAEQGITEPTPIQKKAIPHAMNGRDVMGLAQTGTGKTAAFGLPMIHALMSLGVAPAPKSVNGLILAPTRELANQIAENLRAYTQGTHLKVNIVVGGASINPQINRLHRGTDLLVATPGRLIDLLEQKAVRLDQTRFLVLDEADQMLDMGFIHALRRIAPLLPKDRQTMLFSATMPKLMAELAANYLTDPIRVEAAPPGKPADKVRQGLIFVEQSAKAELLIEKLDAHRNELALVFARTKHGAEKLMKTLDRAGFAVGSIHGNKSQGQRDRALAAFKAGELRVLVATDVAARGLDIPDVRHVYNFDLPNVPENYVHRIGRTARAGRDGSAVTFCAPAEMSELRAIEKTMGRPIPVLAGTSWAPERAGASDRMDKGPRRGPGGNPAKAAKPSRKRRPRNRTRERQAA